MVKEYHDCLDEEGNCLIIYNAEIRIFFIRIFYSAWMLSDNLNNLTGCSYSGRSLYNSAGNTLIIGKRRIIIDGKWDPVDGPLPGVTYTDGSGRILSWECDHPKASVTVSLEGNKYSGYGYADTILMNIKPDNIPIEELRWGRFHSNDHTIVWIRWEGPHPVNRLYFNSEEIQDAVFLENEITFSGGIFTLSFIEPAVIRSGMLSDALEKTFLLMTLFRKNMRNTMETKYKSRSLLLQNGTLISSGWSLYEVVKWKH
jgi:hypothetical protein